MKAADDSLLHNTYRMPTFEAASMSSTDLRLPGTRKMYSMLRVLEGACDNVRVGGHDFKLLAREPRTMSGSNEMKGSEASASLPDVDSGCRTLYFFSLKKA
jgi:hypothetical protein